MRNLGLAVRKSLPAACAAAILLGLVSAGATPVHATTPGKNGPMVFASDLGFGFELFTINPDATGFHQLTNMEGDAVHPDWSPDGRSIVFELDHPSGPPFCSVVIMNADGTNAVDLTGERNGCEGQPSFTPDGRRIVFGRFNDITNVEAIWIMNLQGGNRRRITTGIGKGVTDPNVSPLGRRLSFVAFNGRECGQALYTVRMDGSHLRQILPFRFQVAVKHDWAPDGRRIVFTRQLGECSAGSSNVGTVRPDGTRLRFLTHLDQLGVNALAGSYSPDGRWIVFRLENLNREKFRIMKMHPDGSHRSEIAPLPFSPRFIDWGPHPQP
jgi:Tol biopolymer transport system component